MEPVVLALASNQRYFPGLYCAVASALSELDPVRRVSLKVLDGGILPAARETLTRLVERLRDSAQLEFVTVDLSVFQRATLGPGQSHMTYCRLLLPQLLNVARLIYLDSDVLVFRDVSELFERELSPDKVLAAVRDSETLSFADDSRVIADATRLQPEAAYFNCGIMLMDLDKLRQERLFERGIEFLNNWNGNYKFWDQSAINFLLHGQIQELPEHWNRPAWRFDEQQKNDLNCIVHYTTSAPWFGGARRPAQMLFEQFAAEAGLPVNRRLSECRRSTRRNFLRNALAPFRAVVFLMASSLYKVAGRAEKSATYRRAGRYWLDYIRNAPSRRRLHCLRSEEIGRMKFRFHASPISS